MQLKWFEVRDFHSIRNSGRIAVSDITCLVGKNEAGKSALLKALYKLNPVVEGEGNFDVTNDYPRMDVEDYFDEYYQMTGHENIEALIAREAASPSQLKPSDYPLLGLVRLARLKLPELINPASTIELKNKLEGASNHLTRQILKYWSQNKHLRMTFDVRPARAGDPVGMQNGTNIWGGVFDNRHQVTTELGSRSRGFVWFFSFLAWYSDVKKNAAPMILLLDEPGLTLHAKAQYDLLRYFETELRGSHQLLYSTHSPFMIDPEHFERVRIVQDKSIDAELSADGGAEGTQVLDDVFAANTDSLFPLQGALGYELHQTLFVGPYTLVVEGAADLLFLQVMSATSTTRGRLIGPSSTRSTLTVAKTKTKSAYRSPTAQQAPFFAHSINLGSAM